MRYQVLLLDIPKNFYNSLKYRFQGVDVNFIVAITLRDAASLCAQQQFHLIVLDPHDDTAFHEYLIAIRRLNYAPIVALLDNYSTRSACAALRSGADLCVGTGWPIELAIDHIMAQFRRYTAYNNTETRHGGNAADFQRGDIYIDPLRNVVRVREKSVRLRRREFLLLLYFMKNPKMILTAEQICENAWGSDGSYAQGVSGPIAILRKAIEPDPAHPIYIKTVNAVSFFMMISFLIFRVCFVLGFLVHSVADRRRIKNGVDFNGV